MKAVGELTYAIARPLIDEVLLLEEPFFERAIALYCNVEKTVAEGAGAAALAALLAYPERFRGKKCGLIITGGNIDPRLLASVLTRELVRAQRLVSLRIIGDDRPGLLATVSETIGSLGGNILEVAHNRLALDVPAKGAEFDVMIETRDAQHTQEIMDALRDRGYPPRAVWRPVGPPRRALLAMRFALAVACALAAGACAKDPALRWRSAGKPRLPDQERPCAGGHRHHGEACNTSKILKSGLDVAGACARGSADEVKVSYEGKLSRAGQIFDSSLRARSRAAGDGPARSDPRLARGAATDAARRSVADLCARRARLWRQGRRPDPAGLGAGVQAGAAGQSSVRRTATSRGTRRRSTIERGHRPPRGSSSLAERAIGGSGA